MRLCSLKSLSPPSRMSAGVQHLTPSWQACWGSWSSAWAQWSANPDHKSLPRGAAQRKTFSVGVHIFLSTGVVHREPILENYQFYFGDFILRAWFEKMSLQVGVVAAFVHFSKEAVNKKKENLLTESDKLWISNYELTIPCRYPQSQWWVPVLGWSVWVCWEEPWERKSYIFHWAI